MNRLWGKIDSRRRQNMKKKDEEDKTKRENKINL